jgi:hypothetical protein
MSHCDVRDGPAGRMPARLQVSCPVHHVSTWHPADEQILNQENRNGLSIASTWPAEFEPTEQGWDEMARWSEQVLGPPRGGHITDEDAIIATGCAG